MESLAVAETVVFDKTGTLTEGKLSVGRILTGDGTAYRDAAHMKKAAPALFGCFSEACRINTSSVAGRDGDGVLRALGGNATDRALLESVLPFSQDATCEAMFSIPFDSEKKTSCAVGRRGGQEVLFVKGAPERLMARLTDAYAPDGTRKGLNRAELATRIQAMTEKGGRLR